MRIVCGLDVHKDIQKSSIIATFSCILMRFKDKFAEITRETMILDRLLNKTYHHYSCHYRIK